MRSRSVNKRGRELRHGKQDLENMIRSGMKSPRAEEFVGVMESGCVVLSQAIHHKSALDPQGEQMTTDILLIYNSTLGQEALGRAVRLSGISDEDAVRGLQDGTWDPFSDELVEKGFDGDPAVIDAINRGSGIAPG